MATDAEAMRPQADRATLERVIDEVFEALGVQDNDAALVEIDRLRTAATQPSPHSGEWNAESIERLVYSFGIDPERCRDIAVALTRPIQQSGGEEPVAYRWQHVNIVAWRVRWRQYGFDCARIFDNQDEAEHHTRHLRLRTEVSIIYGIQRLGLIDELTASALSAGGER